MGAVSHVFDGTGDVEHIRTRQLIAALMPPGIVCDSLAIGPGGISRDPLAAAVRLRRSGVDIVHAWGSSALLAAGFGTAGAIVYTPIGSSPATVRLLRWVNRWRGVHVVCRTATERDALRAAGVQAQCTVIRPAVDTNLIDRSAETRRLARAALGLAADDIALLAVGESTRGAAHASAVWATGILNVLDPRYKLLLWGRGPLAGPAVALSAKLRQRDMVKAADPNNAPAVPWESLVIAADIALSTAESTVATWPVAVCMAAGLPIVSTIHRTTSDFLTSCTARLATDRSPRALARCVLDVREDPAAASQRATAAETKAAEQFSIDSFGRAYAELYKQVVGSRPATTAVREQGRHPIGRRAAVARAGLWAGRNIPVGRTRRAHQLLESWASNKERPVADSIFSNGGPQARGGLDRYLGPEAVGDSKMPPLDDPDAPQDRELDCNGADAGEAVCEIAKAEENPADVKPAGS